MILSATLPWLVGAIAAGLATPLLIRLATQIGWVDAAGGIERERKLQGRPVPAVGGAAILIGLVATRVMGELPWGEGGAAGGVLSRSPAQYPGAGEAAAWGALTLAFLTGLIDDLRAGGLSPAVKLAGQALAGVTLALPAWLAGDLEVALGVSGAALLMTWTATNVWNTFDNADGAATGLGALGLGIAGVAGAGAALGFLPYNLLRSRHPPATPHPPSGASTSTVAGAGGFALATEKLTRSGPSSVPRAYLGDSGSHLLGILILLTPAAWPVLVVPAADLARLAWLRRRLGRPAWSGDRLHLAHRFQAMGLRPAVVLGALALLAAPALLWSSWIGVGGGLGAFALAIALSRRPPG